MLLLLLLFSVGYRLQASADNEMTLDLSQVDSLYQGVESGYRATESGGEKVRLTVRYMKTDFKKVLYDPCTF